MISHPFLLSYFPLYVFHDIIGVVMKNGISILISPQQE